MARRKPAIAKKPKFQPPIYTDEAIIAALEATLGMVTLAAEKLGCAPSTIYRREKESPAVHEAIHRIADKQLDMAELELVKQIRSGNTTALIFYLKTKGKQRGFVERTEVVQIPAEVKKELSEVNIEEADFWASTLNELRQIKAERSIKTAVVQ